MKHYDEQQYEMMCNTDDGTVLRKHHKSHSSGSYDDYDAKFLVKEAGCSGDYGNAGN